MAENQIALYVLISDRSFSSVFSVNVFATEVLDLPHIYSARTFTISPPPKYYYHESL